MVDLSKRLLVPIVLLLVLRHSAQSDDRTNLNRRAISILRRECVACHGPEKQEANLRLDSRTALFSGGDNGAVLTNVPRESMLLKRIEHSNLELKMPPKRPMNEADVAAIKAWIHSGANWPDIVPPMSSEESKETNLVDDAWSDPNNPIRKLFDGKRLDLWSLKPMVRPAIPEVKDPLWCSNPIDHFVLRKWESEGLKPAPQATDRVLARRVTMDLVGLPLAYEEIEAIVSNESFDKYSRLIERCIESPEFGVHWARFWLDVVRYSDSNGFDWDELRPDAWRYRDYVVRVMNRDLPFDQFVTQQLAGDELIDGPPRTSDEQDALIATGYLRLGPQDNAASLFNEQDRARAELMADLTETTASAILGMTMSCCRCHDHKTDPLSQADHFRFRAFFAACHFPENPAIDLQDAQTEINTHNEKLDHEIETIKASVAELVKMVVERQTTKVDEKKVTELMTSEERKQHERLESEIKTLGVARRPFTNGLLMSDKRDAIMPTFIFSQGDHRTPRAQVEPGFPSVLFPNDPKLIKPKSSSTTGRRLTLARWMTSHENPWTARVIVNRLWQSYFGVGIVSTPNDFGVTGAVPTHPELLDFLASELIDSGWSLKRIHRLIVTSRCYRQLAVANGSNQLDSVVSMRTNLRRLSAEQLRDSILKSSGLLQNRPGGPPIWPELDAETLAANPAVLDDNETKTKGWYPSPTTAQTVRSLYLIQKRTIRIPWLETFDLPENGISCGRRECSTVAPQSLTLMNGGLSAQAAQAVADGMNRHGAQNSEQQSRSAFRMILQRNPSERELDTCVRFLVNRTVVELCLALFNSNEFVFVE